MHADAGHIEADNLVFCPYWPVAAKETMMTSNRNLIIGAVVVVVVIAAYFAIRAYNATSPQTTPAATTEPKK